MNEPQQIKALENHHNGHIMIQLMKIKEKEGLLKEARIKDTLP